MSECTKCGKCCYFTYKERTFRCPYLLENNLCEIYEHRLGTIIAEFDNIKYVCDLRDKQNFPIQNCPLNKEKYDT